MAPKFRSNIPERSDQVHRPDLKAVLMKQSQVSKKQPLPVRILIIL